MEFIDFEIRAWQADDEHVAVLVHSSPLGEMRRPTMVACNVAAVRPTGKLLEVAATFRRLLSDNDIPSPDRVDYAAESVIFIWDELRLAVFVDFDGGTGPAA